LETLKYPQKATIYIPRKRLMPMPSTKLDSKKNPVIVPLLAKELEREIPNLDIYGSERKLLDFAYQDLETCLDSESAEISFEDIDDALNDETRQDEIESFLKIWTTQWLKKWRERVTLCQKMPQISFAHLQIKNKAAKIFKHMEKEGELKRLVLQKLISNGEICMAGLIAKNLIIEEIACRIKTKTEKELACKNGLDPWIIFQAVMPRINRLTERKVPLIHLKLMADI
jgi:hypothetical protein